MAAKSTNKTASKGKDTVSAVSKAAEAVNVKESDSAVGEAAEQKRPDGKILVISKEMAGKGVFGTTGTLIKFDAIGRALVSPAEAEHFKKIPGYTLGTEQNSRDNFRCVPACIQA